MNPRPGRGPEVLFPRTTGIAEISGVQGELTLEVDAEGRISADFISADQVPDSQEWLGTVETRDVAATLIDGRNATLRDCALTRSTVAFGRKEGSRFELGLVPNGLTVVCSTATPGSIEFALVNQWLTLREHLQFDGFDMEIRPADPDAGGHAGLAKGKPSWITQLVAVPTPDPASEGEVVEVIECLAYTLSLLTMEHVVAPLRRVLDAQGEMIRWEFRRTFWPVHSGRNTPYVGRIAAPLHVVGERQVRRKFEELDLKRYIDYLLESRRLDMYAELCLTCVLFALESLGAAWFLSEGCSSEDVATKSIVTKLDHINSRLRFIPKKYKSDWLYDGLRNPLVHTGAVPLMTPTDVHRATEELLVLAADIFFRIFDFDKSAA